MNGDSEAVVNNEAGGGRYLRGAMQAGQEVEGEKQGLRLLPPAALKGGLGAAGSLQAEAQASELYVRLLCQFEPAAVLPFLQNHEAYRVQARMHERSDILTGCTEVSQPSIVLLEGQHMASSDRKPTAVCHW